MPAALQTTPTVVQLTLSVYMLMLGLGQLIFGPLSDRIGRRPVVLGGALLYAAASWRWPPPAAAACSSRCGCCRRWAPRPRWWPCSPPCATFMPTGRKAPPSMACSAPCWPSSPRSGRCSARPSRRASAGGRSSSRWARRPAGVVARHAALARDPSIRAGRAAASRPCWAACGSGSIRWDSARRWAPSSCSSRPRRACSWARPATPMAFSAAFSTVALVMIAATRLAPRLVARWGIAGSFARGRRRCWRARRSWPAAPPRRRRPLPPS